MPSRIGALHRSRARAGFSLRLNAERGGHTKAMNSRRAPKIPSRFGFRCGMRVKIWRPPNDTEFCGEGPLEGSVTSAAGPQSGSLLPRALRPRVRRSLGAKRMAVLRPQQLHVRWLSTKFAHCSERESSPSSTAKSPHRPRAASRRRRLRRFEAELVHFEAPRGPRSIASRARRRALDRCARLGRGATARRFRGIATRPERAARRVVSKPLLLLCSHNNSCERVRSPQVHLTRAGSAAKGRPRGRWSRPRARNPVVLLSQPCGPAHGGASERSGRRSFVRSNPTLTYPRDWPSEAVEMTEVSDRRAWRSLIDLELQDSQPFGGHHARRSVSITLARGAKTRRA